jgi:hypothetical protein
MALPLFGFTETMRGTWSPLDGSGRKTMWFEAQADATSALEYLKSGRLELSGKMHCESLADDVETTGYMEVQPLARRIGYVLDFRGDDGQRYRFEGQKTLSARRILRTMTRLPGDVLGPDGKRVGTALLYFDLEHDLLPFLATFRRARSARRLREREAAP